MTYLSLLIIFVVDTLGGNSVLRAPVISCLLHTPNTPLFKYELYSKLNKIWWRLICEIKKEKRNIFILQQQKKQRIFTNVLASRKSPASF